MRKILQIIVFSILFLSLPGFGQSSDWVRGIYISRQTLEDTHKIKYLIQEAQAVGINTFVIDFEHPSEQYLRNLILVKNSQIRFVARIIMFPLGAVEAQLASPVYLNNRYHVIKEAVQAGAQTIQLDYIRYRASQPPSSENAKHIYAVIQSVRQLLEGTQVELQVDIFGIAALREAYSIGQSAPLFAQALDAFCPMVYPSHYEPYAYHAEHPYETVYHSLTALRQQILDFPTVQIVAYIEILNFRHPMSVSEKIRYVLDEMAAVRDSKANGWYVWNVHNNYQLLFDLLRNHTVR